MLNSNKQVLLLIILGISLTCYNIINRRTNDRALQNFHTVGHNPVTQPAIKITVNLPLVVSPYTNKAILGYQ